MSTINTPKPPSESAAAVQPPKSAGNPIAAAWNRTSSLMPFWAWALLWLVVAILYGLYGDEFNDSLYESIIQTLAYVMMALGLNIVVGFAGLLDLGYVAFFAIGAFVAGWFMSGHFSDSSIHFIVADQDGDAAPVGPGVGPEARPEVGGRVRADREEGHVAEVEQAGEAHDDVEAQRHHHVGGGQDHVVEDVAAGAEAQRGDRGEREHRRRCAARAGHTGAR